MGELLSYVTDSLELLVYPAAAYFMTTMLDDPAMLALAFC